MAHGLDAVSIGIKHERGVIAGMIIWTQSGCPIVHAARRDGSEMEGAHGNPIGRPEGEMCPVQGADIRLYRDRELDAVRIWNRSVIRAAVFEVK